jgi:hypothetical protein
MPIIAESIIERFEDPPLEVSNLTIEPWGNANNTKFVVEDLELERSVHYTESVPGSSNVMLDGRLRVLSEAWNWSDGNSWTVTIEGSLESYEADLGVVSGQMKLNDATLGQLNHNRLA